MSGARSVMESSPFGRLLPSERAPGADKPAGRIVDMHVHFDEKNPGFLDDLLKLANRMNLTACLLTPFAHRRVVVEAAKLHPDKSFPSASSIWTRRMWSHKWRSYTRSVSEASVSWNS